MKGDISITLAEADVKAAIEMYLNAHFVQPLTVRELAVIRAPNVVSIQVVVVQNDPPAQSEISFGGAAPSETHFPGSPAEIAAPAEPYPGPKFPIYGR